MTSSIAQKTRVLIVGAGLSGSLTCYHLRALAKKVGLPLHIDVTDMARGPGGRMSTTRFGADGVTANTGAQYLSALSPRTMALLEDTVDGASSQRYSGVPLDRMDDPVTRSTHFALGPDAAYTHWLPRGGATNSAVKKFLYGGAPDKVVFESRLQRVTVVDSPSIPGPRFAPLFDRGGTNSTYDIVVLAMPPKDILKFFDVGGNDGHDPQSQADLHRRTNRGRSAPLPPDHRGVVLPSDVVRRLRKPSYVGRYSLALWLHDAEYAHRLRDVWNKRGHDRNPVIDVISSQEGGVLVVQSTVELWRRMNQRRGGRGGAKASIVEAIEHLAGEKLPRVKHTKLLNWRTSQVRSAGDGIVTAEAGRLIFTGDWCYESSCEGCNLAAQAAANTAIDSMSRTHV